MLNADGLVQFRQKQQAYKMIYSRTDTSGAQQHYFVNGVEYDGGENYECKSSRRRQQQVTREPQKHDKTEHNSHM